MGTGTSRVEHPFAPELSIEVRGGVHLVTLDRPDALNAVDTPMHHALRGVWHFLGDDPAVRAIVVTGAGRGFCVGADFDDLKAVARSDRTALERSRPISFPMTIRKPLVAAINGPAAGVGFVQTLYCDVRVTAPTVKLTTAFARRGLIAEYGCHRISREVRRALSQPTVAGA